MLAAIDAIEASFGMVPGKFISRRGRKAIADFAEEHPRRRVTLENMVRLFEAFDKSIEVEEEQSVSEWMSQNQSYSDYYGDAQRVSEYQTPDPELYVGSTPPLSPKASSYHQESLAEEQQSFPDILGDLPNVLPELDRLSPTRTTQQAPFFNVTSAPTPSKYNGTTNGVRTASSSTNSKYSTKSPMTKRGSLTSSPRASRRQSFTSSRPPTSNSNQTLGYESSHDGLSMSDRSFNKSTPLRGNRRTWAKSNDEAFFERMRTDEEDDEGDFSISMTTDGDTDSLMRINHKHMNELHQLRDYAAFCETQMEDSEQRHVDLEASILAKTKECREHVSRTKAHQEGLEQVSQMISELTEILGRKGKRNSRTGSISSAPDSDVLDAYKSRLEVQLEALGKSGEFQEAEIKRLTMEKTEQQQKVEALEAQIKSLTDSLTKVTDNVTTMASREREDFLEFEARLNNQDSGDFSSINEILEQQNLIINDLRAKLVQREQRDELRDTKIEAVVCNPVVQSTISTGFKNACTILIMVVTFHFISETFFPSNLPEGVLWWMNAPAPIQRVFGALDAWVARHDDFRMPM
ncbi:hypothetical protein CJU90_2259 [Yarrowia sp. C11]|nr:hypothetical protein CJU90_2259 [Yarrowia sp. C11]